jgi:signal transduction histidine kinase
MFQLFTNTKTEFHEQRVKLINHLTFVAIVVTLVYWLLDFIIVTNVPNLIFAGCLIIGVITLALNKFGHHRTAAIFGLVIFNIAIYFIASSESTQTGFHMYLGVTAFAALVIFGFKEKYLGLTFLAFSLTLYFCIFFSDLSPLQQRTFTNTEVATFFIINVLSFVAICSYLFYLVLWINHKNESNLRESEAQIKIQNKELIKTNQELDRFVYSASHDLRAPLSSLSGLITISEASNDIKELKEYLAMMKGRVSVLDKFIVDIINYSRNARKEVVSEKLNLHALVNEVVDGLKFSLGAELISIQNLIPTGSEIITDATRIRIILNNLISNAIRYHDKYKDVCSIQIEENREYDKVVIHVKDNGIGIPEVHQPKVFDMFYKATENASGSGLGLYIASESINKLGGYIELKSQYGEGSTFTIILPIQDVDKIS